MNRKEKCIPCIQEAASWLLATVVLLCGLLAHSMAGAQHLTVNVVGPDGVTPIDMAAINGYRWLIEEDTTHPVVPGAQVSDSLAVSIHKSYAPPVKEGTAFEPSVVIRLDDPGRRYVLSVLPLTGYTMGGANITAGQAEATIRVHPNTPANPLPTAQISVFVYQDNMAINGLPDIPAESGMEGVTIQVFDAAGQITTDAHGNFLGTQYDMTCDPAGLNPGSGNNACLNPDGSYACIPDPADAAQCLANMTTGPDGMLIVKNLAPGNYGIAAVPTDGLPWIQTTAVGGGLHLGTVVQAGEKPFFTQAGPLNMHVFIGFTLPFDNLPAGTGTITGSVANLHTSRPPSADLYPGSIIDTCYVGINSVEAGTEVGLLAQACSPDGTFTITGVPAGTWQLVVWDKDLLNLQSVRTVTLQNGGAVDVGIVPTPRWLGTLQGSVFNDTNRNGLRDDGEPGMNGQAVNFRFKDGSVLQATATDVVGNYTLNQVPPGTNWMIVEVDFAGFEATGATVAVDNGGPLSPLPIFPFTAVNSPQPQPENGGLGYRTELGVVLTEGMIVHADQVNVMNFGKAAYPPGGNGGISGIIEYATTRAEDDPRYAAAEPWEPGVPNVQVNLYQDTDGNGVIDDVDGNGAVQLADADNYPFQWTSGGLPGPEDIDRNYPGQVAGEFNAGDAVQIAVSDSFDDAPPTGCVGPAQTVHGQPVQDCAETMQTWNQLRPAVFDGGYAFDSYVPGGADSGNAVVEGLPAGTYIVEANLPAGYEFVKEEDRNVDFGNAFLPTPLLLPPVCVGESREVPPYFSILTLNGDGQPPLIPDTGVDPADARCPLATDGIPNSGDERRLCDQKQISLSSGQNAALDFHVFTKVPKAGRLVGQIINPFANVNNPNDPNFGGLLGPSWLPVSIQDHLGNEIVRVYSDEWGSWNAMVPSTYTVNVPSPSGVSPAVLTVCANHPGPIPDPVTGLPITDPRYNANFAQPCFNVDAWPGKTSYLPTPVGAIAGFTGAAGELDCEFPDKTPIISQVNGPSGGPWVDASTGGNITLTSIGSISVPNPGFDPAQPEGPGNQATIMRDYGFGDGTGNSSVTFNGVPLGINAWAADGMSIGVSVPAGAATGELIVTRGDQPTGDVSSVVGVTLTVENTPPIYVDPANPLLDTIQEAIDTAAVGSLVLVPPGEYFENLIISKPIRLQGFGAHSTTINASRFADNKAAWQATLADLVATGAITLVEGQREDLNLEDGAGITVFGHAAPHANAYTDVQHTRIDGLTIKSAIQGGGVFISGHAPFTEIGNNVFSGNQGSFGGGLRVGWQSLVNSVPDGYNDAFNNNISVHHNHFNQNGSVLNGGGISLMKGADNYSVTENFICGNYAAANGAGISHLGLSNNGTIAHNKIIFNEAFGEGGGLLVSGEFVPAGAPAGTLTEGSGNVTVNSNLIQGNLGLDDAGGISIFSASGKDVAGDPGNWYSVKLLNNMIVNNVAGFASGGIAMSDTVNIRIINNTIAHNDCTATSAAFNQGQLTTTFPMGAGIVARPNSPLLIEATLAATGVAEEFANPLLRNNIIWHNRSFYWDASAGGGLGDIVENTTSPYWDLQVIGGGSMDPRNCILSNITDPHSGTVYHGSNLEVDPQLAAPYLNILQSAPGATALANFVTFTPLTLTGDYHIQDGSSAINRGSDAVLAGIPELNLDFDGDIRPNPPADMGADEVSGGSSTVANYPPAITSLAVATCQAGQVYSYQVVAGDPDPLDTLTYSLDAPVPAGLTIDPDTGSIGGLTCGALNDQYDVTVRVTDDLANFDTQNYTITVIDAAANQAPVAGNDSYATVEGMTLTIDAAHGVLNNDMDPDPGDTLTAVLATPPASGTLNLRPDGSFDFTPTAGSVGSMIFTYMATDNSTANSNEATVTIFVGAAPSGTGVLVQCPGDNNGDAIIDDPTVNPNAKCYHLTAGDGFVNMADGYLQYIFGFKDVTGIPEASVMSEGALAAELVSPTMKVKQGQELFLTLTNVGMLIRSDLFDPHTIHWHGFPEASAMFDGVPNASVAVNMGHSFTYFYKAVEPGTYIYHCHVEATEHMQMGMYGSIWVEPMQNELADNTPLLNGFTHHTGYKYAYNDGDGSTYYDREYPIQISGFDPAFHDASLQIQPLPFADMEEKYALMNGRGYPETVDEVALNNSYDGNPSQKIHSHIAANQGEKVLLRITSLAIVDYFTLRTLGIPMKVIAKGARLMRSSSGQNLYYDTYSLEIGGGEAFDVILDTTGIPPGTYFMYTTNLNYLNNNKEDLGGMMTEIQIMSPTP